MQLIGTSCRGERGGGEGGGEERDTTWIRHEAGPKTLSGTFGQHKGHTANNGQGARHAGNAASDNDDDDDGNSALKKSCQSCQGALQQQQQSTLIATHVNRQGQRGTLTHTHILSHTHTRTERVIMPTTMHKLQTLPTTCKNK